MADDKQGDTAQAAADAQATDYEAQYKTLQAEHEKTARERDEAVSQVDLLSDYVDWDKVRGGDSSGEKTTQDAPGTKLGTDIEARLAQKERQVDAKLLALQFRVDHPELIEYENTLVSPAIARIRRLHPRTPSVKIVEMAVKDTQEFLAKERAKALDLSKKKAKEEAEVDGLGNDSVTSPTGSDTGGETPAQYMAERRARNEKLRTPL